MSTHRREPEGMTRVEREVQRQQEAETRCCKCLHRIVRKSGGDVDCTLLIETAPFIDGLNHCRRYEPEIPR